MLAVTTPQVNVKGGSEDAGMLSLRSPAAAFFFVLSSVIEMTIDWEKQRCLKLLIRLQILWKVILLTWFAGFLESVCG